MEVKDEPTDRTAVAPGNPGDPAAATAATDPQDGADGADDTDGEDGEGDQPPAPAPQAPPAPAPAPPAAAPQAAAKAPAVVYVAEAGANTTKAALDLLLDACELFGVNPERDQRPVELLSWRYRADNPVDQVPAHVTLVTAGGLKLVHYADPAFPMEPDTLERLRNVFNAWKKDKDGTKVPLPLPEDLTLPEGAVTGLVQADAHVYRQGYLRSGGKTEAARRRR